MLARERHLSGVAFGKVGDQEREDGDSLRWEGHQRNGKVARVLRLYVKINEMLEHT